jgi:anti-anti-sigma regulatory factor
LATGDEVPESLRRGRPTPTKQTARVLVVEVRSITKPDLTTVDALSRFLVSVRGLGCSIRLRNASKELQDLLGLCGLRDVLLLAEELPLVDEWQAEQREQPLGIEEVVEPGDPAL